MTNKNKKHSIQQDVSTKEEEFFAELEFARSDLLSQIDMLIEKRDDLQDKINCLELEKESINIDLHEAYKLISEKILKKNEQPDCFEPIV